MKMCESCPNDSWCETPEITLNKYSGKIATFPSGVCFLCTEKRTCVQGVTEQGSGERGYPHILRQNTHCAGFSSLGQRLWSDGGQHSYDAQRFVCYLLLLTLSVGFCQMNASLIENAISISLCSSGCFCSNAQLPIFHRALLLQSSQNKYFSFFTNNVRFAEVLKQKHPTKHCAHGRQTSTQTCTLSCQSQLHVPK